MNVDWTLSSVDIPLSQIAQNTGASETRIRQMYRVGALGPAPDVAAHIFRLPLYSIAALFAWLDGEKQELARDRIAEVLPCVAGAANIRFALGELAQGRCTVGRGTPSLTNQLWTRLRSEEGTAMLEEKLPGGPLRTHRYAWFDESTCHTSDDLVGLVPEPEKVIDAWSIASRMKQGLRGTLFTTQIA